MHARCLTLFLALMTLPCCLPEAQADNGDEFLNMARHHCPCKYGDPRRCSCKQPLIPCKDCQMSWQPIRSMLHPNLLPASLIRPWPPLNRTLHHLVPKTPQRWLEPGHAWTGCKGGQCYYVR